MSSVFNGVFDWLVRRSARHRLSQYIDEHLRIAERIEPFDSSVANASREVASRAASQLVAKDTRSLTRRFDGSGFATILILVPGSVALGYWAQMWDGWWRWPVLLIAGFFLLVGLLGGWGQLWKDEADDTTAPHDARAE